MKKSIIVIGCVLTLFVLLSAFTSDGNNKCKRKKYVEVNFINTSYDTISDFIFQNKKIGELGIGETSKYYRFDNLIVDKQNRIQHSAEAFYTYGIVDYYPYANGSTRTITEGKLTVDVNLFLSCGIGFNMTLKE